MAGSTSHKLSWYEHLSVDKIRPSQFKTWPLWSAFFLNTWLPEWGRRLCWWWATSTNCSKQKHQRKSSSIQIFKEGLWALNNKSLIHLVLLSTSWPSTTIQWKETKTATSPGLLKFHKQNSFFYSHEGALSGSVYKKISDCTSCKHRA